MTMHSTGLCRRLGWSSTELKQIDRSAFSMLTNFLQSSGRSERRGKLYEDGSRWNGATIGLVLYQVHGMARSTTESGDMNSGSAMSSPS